jgi:WD40 repeat protein
MDDATYQSKIRSRQELWNRWKTSDGSQVITDHTVPIAGVTIGYLNERPTIATGGSNGVVLLYDVSSGQRIGKTIRLPESELYDVAWCRHTGTEAGTIVTLGSDSRIRWWDPATAREVGPPGVHSQANMMAFGSADQEDLIASAGSDGLVTLWNPATKTPLASAWMGDDGTQKVTVIEGIGRSHVEIVGEPLISSDQRIISDEKSERRLEKLPLLPRRITAISIATQNGSPVIVAANSAADLFMWRLRDEPALESFDMGGNIGALCTFQYGNQLVAACGTHMGQILLVELVTGRIIGTSNEPRTRPRKPATCIMHSNMDDFEMIQGGFSILAVGRVDASIDVWGIDGREIGRAWPGHTSRVNSLGVCNVDGWPVVVSASNDETVRLWDLAQFAAEPTSTTKREAFAKRLEELRVADMRKNSRGTSNLISQLGVSSTTFWGWIHGRNLPKEVALVEKLEKIFYGTDDWFRRGELVYLYEEAKREKAIASTRSREERKNLAREVQSVPKDYDVFISYTHKDRRLVQEFADALRARGVRLWYDQWEMKPGDVLRERIGEGIQNASNFVVLLSQASLSSRWVKYELNSGMIEEIERGSVKVIPAFGPGVQPENIPIDLRAKLAIDLRNAQSRATAVDQLVALVQPEKRLREELIARLKNPSTDPEAIKEKRRFAHPWERDKAASSAALRGLARSPGSEPLLAISELVIGNAFNMGQIERAMKYLASRSSDGGILAIAASLLQDGRFYFVKTSILDRHLEASDPANFRSAPSVATEWSNEIVAHDLERYQECGDRDIEHGVVLAQLQPAPRWASLKGVLPNSAIRAAIEYADSRIPGLSSLAQRIDDRGLFPT